MAHQDECSSLAMYYNNYLTSFLLCISVQAVEVRVYQAHAQLCPARYITNCTMVSDKFLFSACCALYP